MPGQWKILQDDIYHLHSDFGFFVEVMIVGRAVSVQTILLPLLAALIVKCCHGQEKYNATEDCSVAFSYTTHKPSPTSGAVCRFDQISHLMAAGASFPASAALNCSAVWAIPDHLMLMLMRDVLAYIQEHFHLVEKCILIPVPPAPPRVLPFTGAVMAHVAPAQAFFHQPRVRRDVHQTTRRIESRPETGSSRCPWRPLRY